MKKLTLAAVATTTILAAGTALAADVYVAPPKMAPPPAPAAAYNWNGAYIGLQGGYDWNSVSTDTPATSNPSGFLLGIYGGYNFMLSPSLLLGIDASMNYDWASATVVGGPGGTAEVDWKGNVRARLGFALDRFLIYAAAGGAWSDLKFSGGLSGSDWNFGWTAGGGVEMALSPNMTARLDYAYSDYGTHTYSGFTAAHTSSTVTLGVAFKY